MIMSDFIQDHTVSIVSMFRSSCYFPILWGESCYHDMYVNTSVYRYNSFRPWALLSVENYVLMWTLMTSFG